MRYLTVLAALGLVACGGGGDPVSPPNPPPPPPSPVPASLSIQAGDNQEAAPGTAVPVAPVFVAKDAQGRPFAGASVLFAVVAGGGTVQHPNGVTGADGTVSPGTWTLGPAEGANQLQATLGSLQPVVARAQAKHPLLVLADTTIGPGGGTIAYTKAGDPLNGVRLVIPSGAYTTSGRWTITYQAGTPTPSRPGLVLAGPLVTVKTTQGRSAKLLRLRLPIRTTRDSFPSVMYYDPVADYLEPVPVLGFDATTVTIGTLHFSSAELARPATASLIGGPSLSTASAPDPGLQLAPTYGAVTVLTTSAHGISSSFNPASDSWEFPNYGSYLTPSGEPSGHSLSAFSWFAQHSILATSTPLFSMFDRIPGPHWPDDPGYRVAALGEQDADWVAAGPVLQAMNSGAQFGTFTRDQAQLFLMAQNILVTHQPQLVAASGPGSGLMALVVFRVSLTEIEVMDPVNPARSFNVPFVNGSFQPFSLPSIVGGTPQLFTQLTMLGSTAVVGLVSSRMAQLLAGQPVGAAEFPGYTVQYYDQTVSAWTNLTGTVLQVSWRDLMLRVLCPTCTRHFPVSATITQNQTAFDVYDNLGNLLGSDRGTGSVAFTVPAGNSKIGVHVLGTCSTCGTRWLHVDYLQLSVNASPLSILPAPLVVQPGVQGVLTVVNAGNTPAQARYDWTFGDGTTARVDNLNTVQKTYASAGSYDIGVTLTDRSTNQIIGRATGKALVGLTVPVWRLTSFRLTLSSFDNLAKDVHTLDAYVNDDEIFRTLQSRPDFGLVVYQPTPATVGGVAVAQGAYLVYDPTRVATGLAPQWKTRTLARPLGWLTVTPDVHEALTFDGLTAGGSLTSGTFAGQAVNVTAPSNPSLTIVYWTISAAKSGSTLTGKITRIERLWEQNCRLVPRPPPGTGSDLVCDPPGSPLVDHGTIRHEWDFSATRIQ